MKTIAAIAMVFLPGTFVASLLALPSFQWDMPSCHLHVRRQFWIYWVITIPLTLLTLLAWFLWSQWKAQKDLQTEEVAVDGVTLDPLLEHDDISSGRSQDTSVGEFRHRRKKAQAVL
jgi:hypothetical protein